MKGERKVNRKEERDGQIKKEERVKMKNREKEWKR